MNFHTKLESLLDQNGKAFQGETLELNTKIEKYGQKKFCNTGSRLQGPVL